MRIFDRQLTAIMDVEGHLLYRMQKRMQSIAGDIPVNPQESSRMRIQL
jgi:hypothetical protein